MKGVKLLSNTGECWKTIDFVCEIQSAVFLHNDLPAVDDSLLLLRRF
jgi:hypothetical protein